MLEIIEYVRFISSMIVMFKFWKFSTQLGQLPGVLVWPLLFVVLSPAGNYDFVLLMIATLVINYILGALIKLIYYKPRPNGQNYTTRIQKILAGSMPSIHTSTMTIVVGLSVIRSLLAIFLYGYSALLVGIGECLIIVMATAVVLSRIELDYHHSVDILAGVAFGLFVLGIMLAFLLNYIV